MNPISVLLVDDHKLVRESWESILSSDPRFSVIGQAGSAIDAIAIASLEKPAIVLMDINMQPVNGFEATKSIRACSPGSEIIGVSMHIASVYVKSLFRCGAKGYVTKNSPKEEMFEAIIKVSEGQKYVCKEIKNILSSQLLEGGDNDEAAIDTLSGRQMEIIKLIREGLSSKNIAAKLGLSCRTVEVHRHNITKKLNMKNSAALVNFINANVIPESK